MLYEVSLAAFKKNTQRKGQAHRAISIAPADHGFVKRIDGFGAAGDPGCNVDGGSRGWRRAEESRGEEKERRYMAIKNSSFMAQNVKRTFCDSVSGCLNLKCGESSSYIVGVVLLQNPAPAFIYLLMALTASSHHQRCVNMHKVTCEIEAD